MDPNKQKEEFGNAFLRAVAATSGVGLSVPIPDDDSVDFSIHQTGGGGTTRSPRLDVQMKCTSEPDFHEDRLHFALPTKNHNDLADENVMVPRILVVVVVPFDVTNWVHMDETKTHLNHCAYWKSLRGANPSDNVSTVTVHIPRSQTFDVAALSAMMTRLGRGELP